MSGSIGYQQSSPQLDLFFNTVHLSEEEHRKRCIEVGRQNGKILRFFQENPRANFTPFEVWEMAAMKHMPITSIRRGINTLTQAGYLVKTDIMKDGDYGVKNHTWRYHENR